MISTIGYDFSEMDKAEEVIRAKRDLVPATENQVFAAISANKGSSVAAIYAVTQYVPGKSGCTVKSRLTGESAESLGIFPVVKGYCARFFLGAEYESTVQRQADREETGTEFKASAHKWAERIEGNPFFVRHAKTGEIYLRGIIPAPTKPHAWGFQEWLDCDGNPLSPEMVERVKSEFLRVDKGSKTQEEAGVEDQVIYLNPALANVRMIVAFGKAWEIIR